MLRRRRLQHRVEDATLDVNREQGIEHLVNLRLELVQRQQLGVVCALDAFDDLEWQQAYDLGDLGDHADEAVEEDVDLVHPALRRRLHELRDESLADLLCGLEHRLVRATDPLGFGFTFAECEVSDGLTADQVIHDHFAFTLEAGAEFAHLADDLRAERSCQPPVRREQHDGCASGVLGLGGEDVVDVREGGDRRHGARHSA